MPDRKQLQQLLVRVEGAGGEDRELDIAVAAVLFPLRRVTPELERQLGYMPGAIEPEIVLRLAGPNTQPIPYWSKSVDAALALVERLLPGCVSEISWWPRLAGGEQPNNRHARAILMQVDHDGYGRSKTRCQKDGSTLPLAILAALLMAPMQMQDENV